ncbi:type IV pilus biogenesis protein PilP [Roseateles sp. YR242]|uniref:type IV pilus biogenesis protein PilP n=1 Tax=Roseateles sp. YR242 TaxID=1855305 RepID=UPI0008B5477C|nr:type IV pilus biogenesis protein PilP [Roseateles sp. YR242]SEK64548.1 type IV pilus biogenesis protein PilP [Roseateles sp. YR242]
MRNEGTPRLGGFWLLAAAVGVAVMMAPPAHAGTTAEELAQIEAEHVVLKARLRVAETRAQIAARQADIDRQAPYRQNGLPTVLGIEGLGRRVSATLAMENGSQLDVVVGDLLPDGVRVVAIAATGVTVMTAGRKQLRLRAAADLGEGLRPAATSLGMARSPFPAPGSSGMTGLPALAPMVPPAPSMAGPQPNGNLNPGSPR